MLKSLVFPEQREQFSFPGSARTQQARRPIFERSAALSRFLGKLRARSAIRQEYNHENISARSNVFQSTAPISEGFDSD